MKAFDPGQLVMTTNAANTLDPEDVHTALQRHLRCDWGELCEEDRMMNDEALEYGDGRLFSVYRDRSGIKFYIITEADRSATTVLLPEDY